MTTNKETKKVKAKMFSSINELIKLPMLTAYDDMQVLYPKPLPGIIHCGSATNVTESFFRQIPTHDPCICIHANYIFNFKIFSKENFLDEAFQFGINQNFRNLWYIYCSEVILSKFIRRVKIC
jgi:hypothetical protein